MPTLYVENVPDAVYAALRGRARASGHSISAEALALLKQNAPTPNELARRRALLDRALRLQARRAGAFGPPPKKSSGRIGSADRVGVVPLHIQWPSSAPMFRLPCSTRRISTSGSRIR